MGAQCYISGVARHSALQAALLLAPRLVSDPSQADLVIRGL